MIRITRRPMNEKERVEAVKASKERKQGQLYDPTRLRSGVVMLINGSLDDVKAVLKLSRSSR